MQTKASRSAATDGKHVLHQAACWKNECGRLLYDLAVVPACAQASCQG